MGAKQSSAAILWLSMTIEEGIQALAGVVGAGVVRMTAAVEGIQALAGAEGAGAQRAVRRTA